MSKQKILVIEDDPDGRAAVADALKDAGFEVVTAVDGSTGCRLFKEQTFDVVLSDLILPDIDGITVLKQIKQVDVEMPVLIMTAYGTVSTAVQALKDGAYDYITKPLDLDDLQSKVRHAAETQRLKTEVTRLRQCVDERYGIAAMVAESRGMQEVIRQVKILADTTATVLIQGESGTGKELVARALHVEGRRSGEPFVAINCGAFAESLLESELFGHEKGAFTGAVNTRKGAFERAHGGSLFLDEIGNAPMSVQVKLLRALEEREMVRVGGQCSIPVDVRVISASNRMLDELVEEGEFREDLFYRLKVVDLTIPPLRKRPADIRPLVDRFVALSCSEHGRNIKAIDGACYDALEKYDWPGNVRQLRNAVESAVIMVAGPILRISDFRIDHGIDRVSDQFHVPDGMTLDELDRAILLQLLQRNDGNRTIVADKLGISRRTIQRKIKEYDLPF